MTETGIVTFWRAVDAVLARWKYRPAKASEVYRWAYMKQPEIVAAAIVRSRRLRTIEEERLNDGC